MTKRITQIKASELDLQYVGKVVEVTGTRLAERAARVYMGSILRIEHAAEIYNKVTVTLGPAVEAIAVTAFNDSDVRVLDADTQERRSPTHFGSSS